jgi:hypothetical protein
MARFGKWGVALLAASVLAGCSSAEDMLDSQRAQWQQHGPVSYQYTFTGSGMAVHDPLRITVTDKTVTETEEIETGRKVTGGRTIDKLFDDVARRLSSDCKVDVAYDETLGYPLHVSSDCGQEADGWTVEDFASRP